ncbi:MAG: hypothetical protein J1D87_00170 [Lachnospiraceae bacterium]|nr:hypothetical protein [Lachnospiraceae bacterium]
MKKEHIKKEALYRWLSLLLSICMVFSMLGGRISFSVLAREIEQIEPESREEIEQTEPQEEVKVRLLRQIKDEGWNPYSVDMSIEEFYALMDLFQEGRLPMDEEELVAESSNTDPNIEDGESGNGTDELYIPSTMFLFSGLNTESMPGRDSAGYNWGKPLEYHNDAGDENYPAGLNSYDNNYTRPPEGWRGVEIKDNMQAYVIVPGINKNDHNISGDVDQKLFLQYNGYYVRRVTAQNNDVTILGAIKLQEQNTYLYYYINNEKQSTEVSVTTLPEGQKFIIQYYVNDYSIEYQVKMNDVNGEDVTPKWVDNIFGTDRTTKTNLGAYAFTAQAPDGYTLSFYLVKKNSDGSWSKPKLQLGTKEEREKDSEGLYTGVNGGWALGEEPVYDKILPGNDYSVLVNTDKGPGTLMTSGTFYNNQVDEDRRIIAVLRPKSKPVFAVRPVQEGLTGVKGRGTAAAEGYDWEADYEYAIGKRKKDPYPKRPASYPNLGDPASPNWDWGNSNSVEMKKEADGTYSYSWIFQTNTPQVSYFMDALEVNGVGITVPFYPHYLWDNKSGESIGSEGGMDAWYAETTLPDGAVVRVEYLLVFGNAQRHYRIIVTNARANVSITGMNLNMYITGAPEFSVYHLEGVTGVTVEDSNAHVEAIQYYDKGDTAKGKKTGWSEDRQKANVVIDSIDYKTGDTNNGGANIRFKLANGYDSPYYLYESARDGVIYGRDHSLQASAMRDETGHVDRESQNAVVPYVSDGTKPWMRYDGDTPIPVTKKGELLYDEDGNPFTDWSKIRIGEDDEEQVLIPRLYATPGPHNPEDSTDLPLTKEEVIADKGEKVFNFGEDINVNLKSRYIYEGADGWYYIRLTGQGRWINDDIYVDPSSSGNPYKIALLTIVARPKRYVVRYMPNTLEGIEDAEGNVIVDERLPGNMPVINHYASCPKFFREDDPEKPEEQFDDNSGAFYDVDVNTIAVLRRDKPTDPKSYYKFVDWVLVDEDYQPVRRHVIGPDGYWLKVNGEYVMEEVHFTSGSIDIKDISVFGILNDDMGAIDMDIYVLLLMPTWDKIEKPFHYTVALNWVDASGGLHDKYFHGYWSDVQTYYELDEKGLTVKVLTESEPFKKWLDRHPGYTFWDAVNNATDGVYYNESDSAHEDRESDAYMNLTDDEKSEEEKIRDALDAYFPEIKNEKTRQKKYDAVLKSLLNKDKGGSSEVDDFNRNGDYTFTVWEDKGVIAIWMYESDPQQISAGNGNSGTEPGNSEIFAPSSEDNLTNTPTTSDAAGLPQTGQLWWPVPLLVAVGGALLMTGASLFIRKKESEEFDEPYD